MYGNLHKCKIEVRFARSKIKRGSLFFLIYDKELIFRKPVVNFKEIYFLICRIEISIRLK